MEYGIITAKTSPLEARSWMDVMLGLPGTPRVSRERMTSPLIAGSDPNDLYF